MFNTLLQKGEELNIKMKSAGIIRDDTIYLAIIFDKALNVP